MSFTGLEVLGLTAVTFMLGYMFGNIVSYWDYKVTK